jgi:signal transduction histidine kinase
MPGSGIGLAVVRELVVAHEGECHVESAEGGGSRFVVELPGGTRADARAESDRRADAVEVSWPGS